MAAKTMNVEDILAQLNQSGKEARAANEKRYSDILGTYENAGRSAKGDVDRATADEQAKIQQGLVSRGLGQTSVLEASQGEAGREGTRQKNRIDEDVAASKAGVMERRTDAYPDQGLYASLLSKLGQGAGASADMGRRQETIGNVPGGDGFGGGGGGGSGGGSGGSGGGYRSGYAASLGGGGGAGGVGSYSNAGAYGRGGGALPGGSVEGFYGSYSGTPGAYGGSTLTGADAVRFGGQGTNRVSIPPMIGMGSYYGAGGGGSLGSNGGGYAGNPYVGSGSAPTDESSYFTGDSGYDGSGDGSPESPDSSGSGGGAAGGAQQWTETDYYPANDGSLEIKPGSKRGTYLVRKKY